MKSTFKTFTDFYGEILRCGYSCKLLSYKKYLKWRQCFKGHIIFLVTRLFY